MGNSIKRLQRLLSITLDRYCVSSGLFSAYIAEALLFVNILVSGIFHGHFAQRLAVNKPCLQIVRRLLWKQTTTHSIRNNNPIFDREEPLVKQIRPTVYRVFLPNCEFLDPSYFSYTWSNPKIHAHGKSQLR